MSAYEAVCFDLDETLCEPTRPASAVLEETFRRADVEPYCSIDALRTAAHEVTSATTDRAFFERLFATLATRSGVDASVAPTLAETYLETVDPSAVRFRPGAKRALDVARERGPLGLITNGSPEMQTQKLERLDLLDVFDVTVFTDPVAGVDPKPSAIPFERALSALECDPAEVIHVGDSLRADVAGANGVGMDSAWLDHGSATVALDGGESTSRYEPTVELSTLEAFETIV